MERITLRKNCSLVFVVAALLAVAPAIADKPTGAGGGKHQSTEKHENQKGEHQGARENSQGHADPSTIKTGEYFGDQHRTVVHHYYEEQFRTGRCPPGLAKKHNGCMPPGQAKKWTVGRPLPRDVVYYEVPSALVVQVGPPPVGYRYVRVATDILMIAIGTGMVVDAIQDLGRI